ncbi:hypothetical protein AXF42_Ash001019 [Apostasia shenzhenica]|uniref:U5 small nuclear ribonucleoprotein TSSC4 n=1 Tax=Apostasia shenzhenica TaxID=1088818 RepID=A0A2I0ATT6_9ASPA|nr:hypothetical protein AXF42_Ash001019 [Apostasia shenzhenica]
MEDSFETRVKRLFGSLLFETVPSSSFPASSWSVAGGEVERREWNRGRGAGPDRSEDPCSSAFAEGGCFANKRRSSQRGSMVDFERYLDEVGEDEDGGGRREEDLDSEIRSSIGLDPTVDHELILMVMIGTVALLHKGFITQVGSLTFDVVHDEEDEYDRVAIGREDAGERVYMRDVKDHGSHLNYHSICEHGLEEPSAIASHFCKDPRADHFAASVRLEEDKKAFDSFSVLIDSKYQQPGTSVSQQKAAEESDINLKPILKRKDALDDSKPKKRVRFDSGFSDRCEKMLKEEAHGNSVDARCMETTTPAASDSSMVEASPGVPDYIRNPFKYTHYSLDSYDDDDDVANKRAFGNFRSRLNKSIPHQLESDVAMELPMSVTFTPRKKSVDAMPVDSGLGNGLQYSISKESQVSNVLNRPMGIAADEPFEGDTCEMDEDDLETKTADVKVSSARIGRRYRSTALSDE